MFSSTAKAAALLLSGLVAVNASNAQRYAAHQDKAIEKALYMRQETDVTGMQPNRADPQIPGVEFYNNKTASYWVNGSALPDVYFDIGESYAGLLPIDDTKELYFWFVPTTNPAASDEITIW